MATFRIHEDLENATVMPQLKDTKNILNPITNKEKRPTFGALKNVPLGNRVHAHQTVLIFDDIHNLKIFYCLINSL